MLNLQSFSEVGGHRLNEDAFLVQAHPLDPDCWLCIVADGQGGQSGGGPAAQLACQSALAAAIAIEPTRLIHPATWLGILQLADSAVKRDPIAGFTTLVALCVHQGLVVGAASGGSAALLVTDGKSLELTADQQKNPPIGSGMAEAVSFAASLKNPWKLLVMSDGVWKFVGWDPIVEVARREQAQAIIAELQLMARLPGSGRFQDDFTIVVLETVD